MNCLATLYKPYERGKTKAFSGCSGSLRLCFHVLSIFYLRGKMLWFLSRSELTAFGFDRTPYFRAGRYPQSY
jgi:hypothetical protein